MGQVTFRSKVRKWDVSSPYCIVTVFGATGTQGGAIVRTLLADGTFIPRAVTRNPNSASAKKLKDGGAEIVQGDLSDKESIKKVVAGSEAVFGVTNYYDPTIVATDPKEEIKQGKELIDACKEAGVKFFIWSSLPDSDKLGHGKYPGIYHYTNKAEVEEYLKDSSLPNASLHTGYFAENLWNYSGLVKNTSGGYDLVIPCYKATSDEAILWVERDLGACVLGLLKKYNTHQKDIWNETFYAVTARLTFPALAEIISKGIGKSVTFVSAPTSGMKELDVMYEYQSDIGLYTESPIPDPRLIALGVEFGTLEEFVQSTLKPILDSQV